MQGRINVLGIVVELEGKTTKDAQLNFSKIFLKGTGHFSKKRGFINFYSLKDTRTE